MAECSLDLIFLIRDRPFVYLVGGAEADYFQQLKLDLFYRQRESIFLLYNCLQLLLDPIHLFNFSFINKNISDQHS